MSDKIKIDVKLNKIYIVGKRKPEGTPADCMDESVITHYKIETPVDGQQIFEKKEFLDKFKNHLKSGLVYGKMPDGSTWKLEIGTK